MKLIYLIFMLFSLVTQSQNIKSKTSTQNLIIGKSEYPIILGTEFKNKCELVRDQVLPEGEPVFVSSYYSCFSNIQTNYYKVYHNGQPYFVYESELNISDSDKSKLKDSDSTVLANIEADAIENSKRVYDNFKKLSENLLKLGKQKGILITHAIITDESEYTNGTGFKIGIKNLSKKGIKYAWISVKGLNRVKDVVSTKTVKVIGEIEPDNEGSAEFEYVWMTDIVDSFKIPSIKIQYMDGTFTTILNADYLIVPSKLSRILFPE